MKTILKKKYLEKQYNKYKIMTDTLYNLFKFRDNYLS